MTNTKTNSNRIKWVDMAKGIAMLMVIAGHTIGYPGTTLDQKIIRGMIYSFHIPMFFILSGYTSRCSDSGEKLLAGLKKSAKRLLLPAYVLWLVVVLFSGATSKFNYSPVQLGLSALYASAIEYEVNNITIPLFGYIWFLVSLFVIKNLYDIINYIFKGRFMTLVSAAVSAAGVFVGKNLFLPFVIDIAMASMIFYHIGHLLKKRELVFSAKKFGASLLIWLGIFFFDYFVFNSYLDLASRCHSILPISYIAAIAGSLTFMYICMYWCEHGGRVSKFFTGQLYFIGYNSMILYAIHYLDTIWFSEVLTSVGNEYLQLLIRLIEDVGLFYIFFYLQNKFRERKKKPESDSA